MNDKILTLNTFRFKYMNEMLITIDMKNLKTLNKTVIWKAFYVMCLFLGRKPKYLHLAFTRAYKDTIYRAILYLYLDKKVFLTFIFNTVFLVRLAVEVWVYNHHFRYSLTFQTLTFIKDFELNSELYDWHQPINIHILFPTEVASDLSYKNLLLTSLRIMPDA